MNFWVSGYGIWRNKGIRSVLGKITGGLGAGIIWLMVADMAINQGFSKEQVHALILHDLTEYAELLLFLLVSMTYSNAMTERNVFEAVRVWLVQRNFKYKTLF